MITKIECSAKIQVYISVDERKVSAATRKEINEQCSIFPKGTMCHLCFVTGPNKIEGFENIEVLESWRI